MKISQEQIEKAILWYESMGYHAEQGFGIVLLELEGFSVELTENEIEGRAEQWDREQTRKDNE